MEPATLAPASIAAPGTATATTTTLRFKDITLADLPAINRVIQQEDSRTCDYTIGGLYMWINYFRYQYCIVRDTLFIKGVSEESLDDVAFSFPIGPMPTDRALELIDDYCEANGLTMRLSAIPESKLSDILAYDSSLIPDELTDWADYLYDAKSLTTLSGKKLSKKRNHVNRFMADNPGALLEPLTLDNIHEVLDTFVAWSDEAANDPDDPDALRATAIEERRQVEQVLSNYICYPFEGAILRDDKGRMVAFTIGEKIGDTLFVHIEKMDHNVAGAGETVNCLFARMMTERYPDIAFINREEDAGDPGLRRAKESYHPVMLLKKYDLYR